jgi:hypothetical protein
MPWLQWLDQAAEVAWIDPHSRPLARPDVQGWQRAGSDPTLHRRRVQPKQARGLTDAQ